VRPVSGLASRPILRDLAWLVPAAIVVRVIYLLQLASSPLVRHLVVDEAGYDRWARAIAGGEIVGATPFYQAPLYPYLLGTWYALFGVEPASVRALQAAAGIASAVLLYLVGRRVFGPTAGRIAGLGAALYGPFLFYEGMILKETWAILFTNLLILLLLVAMDRRAAWWLPAGVALGLLALLRENALAYLPLIVIWNLARAPDKGAATRPWALRARQIGVLTAGMFLALTPAMAHNVAAGGGLLLTTYQGGTNFYIGNHPGAPGVYTPLRPGRSSPVFEGPDARHEAEIRAGRPLSPGEVSRFWFREGLRFARQRPGEFVGLQMRKLIITWNAREIPDTWDIEFVGRLVPLLRGPVVRFGWIAPLALLGLGLAYPWRRGAGLLALLVAATTFSIVLFYVFARYRLPLAPLALLFAGHALAWGIGAARERRWRALGAAAAALVPLAAVVHLDLARLGLVFTDEVGHQNLGFIHLYDGRTDRAEAEFRMAVSINPDIMARLQAAAGRTEEERATLESVLAHASRRRGDGIAVLTPALEAEAHRRLGVILRDAGELLDAAARFRAAGSLLPEDPTPAIHEGITLRLAGDPSGAARAYAEALARDPGNPLALYNLANVEVDRGDLDAARARLREAAATCAAAQPQLCEPIADRLRAIDSAPR